MFIRLYKKFFSRTSTQSENISISKKTAPSKFRFKIFSNLKTKIRNKLYYYKIAAKNEKLILNIANHKLGIRSDKIDYLGTTLNEKAQRKIIQKSLSHYKAALIFHKTQGMELTNIHFMLALLYTSCNKMQLACHHIEQSLGLHNPSPLNLQLKMEEIAKIDQKTTKNKKVNYLGYMHLIYKKEGSCLKHQLSFFLEEEQVDEKQKLKFTMSLSYDQVEDRIKAAYLRNHGRLKPNLNQTFFSESNWMKTEEQKNLFHFLIAKSIFEIKKGNLSNARKFLALTRKLYKKPNDNQQKIMSKLEKLSNQNWVLRWKNQNHVIEEISPSKAEDFTGEIDFLGNRNSEADIIDDIHNDEM